METLIGFLLGGVIASLFFLVVRVWLFPTKVIKISYFKAKAG